MMKYRTICLDYDGTIHDSIQIYFPAFLKAFDYLVAHGLQKHKNWTREEVASFLGQNPLEMWGSFRPKLPLDVIEVVSKMIGEEMSRAIENSQAKLYQGALETLEYLKNKGYYLVYLSNSKIYYMERNRQQFQLDRYFDRFVVSEQYGYIPKKDILKAIKHELAGPILMIGDRIHDMESGHANEIDTVACRYGFGREEEFVNTTYQIDDISELKEIL